MSIIKSDGSSKYPLKIQHFVHPCPLVLRISSTFYCNACCGHRSDFTYRCNQCDFDMDVECAQLSTITSEGENEQIQHHSHWHPLKPFEKIDQVSCEVCESVRQDRIYGCSQCEFYLHKACMDNLPQNIQHLFHPCPLVLLPVPYSYNCSACDKICSPDLTFFCGNCRFYLDIKCALQMQPTVACEAYGRIKHISHVHPLTLYPDMNVHSEACCRGC
ncbi:protein VACUOLELESS GAMETOPHYTES-like [Hevea brasiliensis]|uniref:protein VACUOLELESS GAMETOPHYTES-like n=1 Tax=Hevea brasiliensis TaxID=3981 RepID=UPI0025D13E85|nr:protein VACUOLELESS GAMETOPHYTES-like [Hevea brasiliensis]